MKVRLNTTVDTERLSKSKHYPLPLVDELVSAINEEQMSRKRQPRTPAPEGGISLSAAGKKYRIHHFTLSRWLDRGCLKLIERRGQTKFVNEDQLRSVILKYKEDPGRGKRTLKRLAQTR